MRLLLSWPDSESHTRQLQTVSSPASTLARHSQPYIVWQHSVSGLRTLSLITFVTGLLQQWSLWLVCVTRDSGLVWTGQRGLSRDGRGPASTDTTLSTDYWLHHIITYNTSTDYWLHHIITYNTSADFWLHDTITSVTSVPSLGSLHSLFTVTTRHKCLFARPRHPDSNSEFNSLGFQVTTLIPFQSFSSPSSTIWLQLQINHQDWNCQTAPEQILFLSPVRTFLFGITAANSGE